MRIDKSSKFNKSLKRLSGGYQKLALRALQRLESFDKYSNSLNLEKLGGGAQKYSIRVNNSFRILLERISPGHFVAQNVGSHDVIYGKSVRALVLPNMTSEILELELIIDNEEGTEMRDRDNGGHFSVEERLLDFGSDFERTIDRIINDYNETGTFPTDNELTGSGGGHINKIPSKFLGPCNKDLLALIQSPRKFDDILRDTIYHAAVYCRDMCANICVITNTWDQAKWNKHEKAFNEISQQVLILLISPAGTKVMFEKR